MATRIENIIEAIIARIQIEGGNVNDQNSSLAALENTVAPEFCKKIYLKYIAKQD